MKSILALSMTWVVLGHSLFIPLTIGSISNSQNVIESWPLQFFSQTVLNAFFSVDSFFFISGALLSYLFLSRQGTKRDLPMMMLCRWVRLTVCMFYINRLLLIYYVAGAYVSSVLLRNSTS